MVMLRKTPFSLGGPERIADPADDVMLELGRQALMRQQQQASLAMEQQRLALARQQAGLAADGHERELARAAAEQAGYVLDPTTGEVATDPDTGAALRTMAARDLEARIGQAASRDAMERARFDREGADSDFSRRMAERGLEERGIDRAQAMAIARMQDETADKRLRLQDQMAERRESAQWDRQVAHEANLLRRDEERDQDRQQAEARKIEHAEKKDAQKVGALASGALRERLRSALPDDPDVESNPLLEAIGGGLKREGENYLDALFNAAQGDPAAMLRLARARPMAALAQAANAPLGLAALLGGGASSDTARTDSETVRALNAEVTQAFAGDGSYAVISPAEIEQTAQAAHMAVDAEFDDKVREQKALLGIDNTAELEVARRAVHEHVDREAAAARGRFAEKALGAAVTPRPGGGVGASVGTPVGR
jgi:hypothetical protein